MAQVLFACGSIPSRPTPVSLRLQKKEHGLCVVGESSLPFQCHAMGKSVVSSLEVTPRSCVASEEFRMSMGCSRSVHDSGFCLHPWSDQSAAHGTGGNADAGMTAYPFDLPSIREGVDIQDAGLFRKPDRGLDRLPSLLKLSRLSYLCPTKGVRCGLCIAMPSCWTQ